MWNVYKHLNVSGKTLRVETALHDISGNLADRATFALQPLQQFDLLVHNLRGRARDSYRRQSNRVGCPAVSLLLPRLPLPVREGDPDFGAHQQHGVVPLPAPPVAEDEIGPIEKLAVLLVPPPRYSPGRRSS
jgi:hypothetical protein